MKYGVILFVGLLSACASLPQTTLTSLNMDDPKYNTDGCRDIRAAAINYDDKVVSRAGLGLATGLLLGPIGIIPAAMSDASQNEKRSYINQEIKRQCVTDGFVSSSNPVNNATKDSKECKEENGKVTCG